jgi:alkylation response protein AidB-like acyl-CoA dehydrogenase
MEKRWLDELLADTDRFFIDAIKAYVDGELMPLRGQLDDDKEHKLVREVLEGFVPIGFQKIIFPEEYGGMNIQSVVTMVTVGEDIARFDAGIALAISCTYWCWLPAIYAQSKAVLDRYAPRFCGDEVCLGAFNITEPASGCDIENPAMHGRTIKTFARRDGDEWVLNGTKCLASNSGVAALYCVVCSTAPDSGDEGIALIYVPASAKGLSFGRFEDKAGLHTVRNCDVYFDNVRVPRQNRAAGPGRDAELLYANVANGRLAIAAGSVGMAQGAFERVLEYTGNRVVGGKPVREHSIAANLLADMAIGIETARAYVLNAAYMYDHPQRYGEHHSAFMLSRASIAHHYATDVAVMVTNRAMELMGAYGYLRELGVEKYWRDCKMAQLAPGGSVVDQLDITRGYYEHDL